MYKGHNKISFPFNFWFLRNYQINVHFLIIFCCFLLKVPKTNYMQFGQFITELRLIMRPSDKCLGKFNDNRLVNLLGMAIINIKQSN